VGTKKHSMAEALAALEKGLREWFEGQGFGSNSRGALT
jgi:hypothetical protein